MAGRLFEKSAGRPVGDRQARLLLADFDLINPKHLLNAYKLKAGSIGLGI